jgi:hypothetical protein
VAYYRLYFLAGESIQHVVEFESACDDDAIAAAESQGDGSAMELWSLDRRVKRFAVTAKMGASGSQATA